MAALIASIGTLAQENTAWNIRNSTTASSARPHTGCITTASMRCWKRSHRAPRPARRGRGCGALRAAGRPTERRRRASSVDAGRGRRRAARRPSWRLEQREQRRRGRRLDGDRLDHRAAELGGSRATSIAMPCARATSAMLSATIIGRPSRFSSSTRRRFMRRLVASTTATIASGAASPARRPSITSSVICSSGVAGVRL